MNVRKAFSGSSCLSHDSQISVSQRNPRNVPVTQRVGRVLYLGLSILMASAAVPMTAYATTATPATANASNQSTDAAMAEARALINDLGTQALELLGNKSIPVATRDAKFHALLDQAFDLNTIGRYVIGRAWLSASPAQREEYTRLFDALVVEIYSDRLSLYSGQKFRIVGARPESDRDVLVTTDIIHPDGRAPTRVDWRVRRFDKRLAIIDVVVEGVSMSVSQRQEYASVIQRNGGKIEGLLSLMRDRLKNGGATPQAAAAAPIKQRQG